MLDLYSCDNTLLLLFSCSVDSDSLRPHELQQARLRCLSLSPGVCSNSCPLSRWWHPTSSSCRPLLLPPSIFPNIRVFFIESVFASGGQSIEASAPVLPMNLQGWFPLGLTSLISLQSRELSKVFSSTNFESISSSAYAMLSDISVPLRILQQKQKHDLEGRVYIETTLDWTRTYSDTLNPLEGQTSN